MKIIAAEIERQGQVIIHKISDNIMNPPKDNRTVFGIARSDWSLYFKPVRILYNFIKSLLEIEKPESATMGEWRLWKKAAKKNHPIRFWLYEELPFIIWHPIAWKVKDAYWAIQHRFNPKHRYHVIKPKTLTPGYYDSCSQILHATMDILSAFVERENSPDGTVDWQADTEHSLAWDEMMIVYNWWKAYPDREKQLPPYPDRGRYDEDEEYISIFELQETEPEAYAAWVEVANAHNVMEAAWAEETKQMLIRVANIREYLWT